MKNVFCRIWIYLPVFTAFASIWSCSDSEEVIKGDILIYNSGEINDRIYRVTYDGDLYELKPFDNSTSSFGGLWSPDGKKIAFVSNYKGEGHYAIYFMNADGSGARPMKKHPNADGRPIIGGRPYSWSHDGTKLAIESDNWIESDLSAGVIYIYDFAKDSLYHLTSLFAQYKDLSPQWLPGDSRILYYSNRDNPDTQMYKMFTMKPDGSDIQPFFISEPHLFSFSHLGDRLHYYDEADSTLHIMDFATRNDIVIKQFIPGKIVYGGKWSGDDKKLLLPVKDTSIVYYRPALYLYDIASSAYQEILDDSYDIAGFDVR
ncbi:hypothetical protein L6Q79_10980 [bacterium]|nr:hypothetical protein [bacterium]